MMAAKKRTTHRSPAQKKLYAKRSEKGEFEDIQSYKRAQGQDIKRVSKAESAARKKAGLSARKTAKKKAAKK
jgi:nucleoid-associated protein YgaU